MEKPLELRLAFELGVPGGTYAPDYYSEVEEQYDQEVDNHYYCQLGGLALQGVKEGRISGGLGLEFLESELFYDAISKHREEIAYHGSPQSLTVIRPSQPTWHAPDQELPYRFADGRPAICASPKTAFPAMRAVIHEAHPAFSNQLPCLSKRTDRFGNAIWFTTEETLEIIRAEDVRGTVHAISLSDGTHRDKRGTEYDPGRYEHRIYGPRKVIAKVQVGVNELPPDLCVIPADAQTRLISTRYYGNVLQWGKSEGVPVRPFGGLWPKQYADY